MDLATILGLFAALGIVMVAVIMGGGSVGELFAQPDAILLTVVGAMMASLVSVSLKTFLNVPKLIIKAFTGKAIDPMPAIDDLTDMADKARRDGLLALEEKAKSLDEPFLRKGVMLVVDGVDPAQVKAILSSEIENMKDRHAAGYGYFNACGGFGPTMGMIGTVLGLIAAMKNLENPADLGRSIAAAFLTTLWGVASSNLLWLPLGGKLEYNSEQEASYRYMLLDGILALQAGENPRMVREKLMAYVPPSVRVDDAAQANAVSAGAEA